VGLRSSAGGGQRGGCWRRMGMDRSQSNPGVFLKTRRDLIANIWIATIQIGVFNGKLWIKLEGNMQKHRVLFEKI
jgi:hypothetical protein